MADPRVYTVRLAALAAAASATNPILQVATPSTREVKIHSLEVSNENSTTSAEATYDVVYSTAVAAGTLANANSAAIINDNSDSNATSLAVTSSGFTGSGAGTLVVLRRKGFNVLNGDFYLPTPQMQKVVPAASYIFIRLVSLSATGANLTWELVVQEL